MTARLRDILFALTLFACSFALAHEGSHETEVQQTGSGRVLGQLNFPTSTQSAEAQAAFEQGMLLLHLFEYPFAEAEFQRAQVLDPDFAMAYWGEAMAHNYAIWDEQEPDKARAVLNKYAPTPEARAAKITSARERGFFESLEILYGPAEGRAPKAERDRAYRHFLGEMARRYPDDHEVRLFHALALMGAHAGVRDIPDYMESAALSQSVFYANREHPGAAHYLIHGVDDPIHAPLGLEAARALYVMAPDAGHSLHMTSHIFNALGMWDDVVIANTNAVKVSNAIGEPPTERMMLDPNLNVLYVKAMLAQSPADIKKYLKNFLELKTELREAVMAQPEQVPFNLLYLDRLDVIEQQLRASLARANGEDITALEYAIEASRLEGEMPFSFGPPFVDYPSAQLMGELAFDLDHHEEAVAAFSKQLKRSRKKTQAVEGLARAEKALGT